MWQWPFCLSLLYVLSQWIHSSLSDTHYFNSWYLHPPNADRCRIVIICNGLIKCLINYSSQDVAVKLAYHALIDKALWTKAFAIHNCSFAIHNSSLVQLVDQLHSKYSQWSKCTWFSNFFNLGNYRIQEYIYRKFWDYRCEILQVKPLLAY